MNKKDTVLHIGQEFKLEIIGYLDCEASLRQAIFLRAVIIPRLKGRISTSARTTFPTIRFKVIKLRPRYYRSR